MKSAAFPLFLLCCVIAHAAPITLLTDSRYRYSNGFAEYDSSSNGVDSHQSTSWDIKASSPFGSMNGYDLNEIPLGSYYRGSGILAKGLVGMSSQFSDGLIGGSGFISNFLGVATSNSQDSGYTRLAMDSHYEITFRVNEAISFDFSGSLLGSCSLSFISDNGFSLQGSDVFNQTGILDCGVYTILADAATSLELNSAGNASDQKQFNFNLAYSAVPDGGTSGLLVGTGLAALFVISRRRKSEAVRAKAD